MVSIFFSSVKDSDRSDMPGPWSVDVGARFLSAVDAVIQAHIELLEESKGVGYSEERKCLPSLSQAGMKRVSDLVPLPMPDPERETAASFVKRVCEEDTTVVATTSTNGLRPASNPEEATQQASEAAGCLAGQAKNVVMAPLVSIATNGGAENHAVSFAMSTKDTAESTKNANGAKHDGFAASLSQNTTGTKDDRITARNTHSMGSSSSRRNGNSMAGLTDNDQRSGLGDLRKSVKESVFTELAGPPDELEYCVSNFYYSEGIMQAIANSPYFGYFTLAVIAANALYMGVDAEENHAASLNKAEWYFIVTENVFCVFFTLELLVRVCAFEVKANVWRDAWFKFDSVLLAIIWIETWVLPLLLYLVEVLEGSELTLGPVRMLRLLRLARLVRIMRAFPELVTMLHGMFVATRAVGSAMVLLVIAIYAWAIIMHALLKDDESVYIYFGTISRCMMTLMANGTLGDSIGTVMRAIARNTPALIALLAFVVFSALTVLNMLIGVLCEVVAEVAHAEQDATVLNKLKSNILVMLRSVDEDGSGDISKGELMSILGDDNALEVLRDLNINAAFFMEMIEMSYDRRDSLKIPYIMQMLVDNQGGRATTVQDLTGFHEFTCWSVRKEVEEVRKMLTAVNSHFNIRVLQHS